MKNRGVFVRKRDKTSFDPKEFLAKVGEGKTISKYRKDQIVFSQGQVADAVFYIQQGQGQAHRRFQARQGSGSCNPGARPLFWRRMSEWSSAAHRNNERGR
jgi:CRP-like cAMP-binding protein